MKFNEDDLMIVDEDEGMPWASPSFDSWWFLIFRGGSMAASPSLSSDPSSISSYSSPLELKNSLHTKLLIIWLKVSAHKLKCTCVKLRTNCKQTSFSISYYLLILYVVLPLKSFTLDDGKIGEYKIKTESVKTGQCVKIEFFEALLQLKSKNLN